MSDLSTLPEINSTPWERAVEAASAERWDRTGQEVVDSFDPWTCPARLLPWLAQMRGLDLWYDDWSEVQKRRAIAAAPRLLRLKGTMAGVAGYLALVGAEITYARRPADQPIAGGMTSAQRDEWLDRLPQLRLYPGRETIQTDAGFADHAFAGHDFLSRDPVKDQIGARLYLWKDGVELPLRLLSVTRLGWDAGGMVTEFTALADDAAEATGSVAGELPGFAGQDEIRARQIKVRVTSGDLTEPARITDRVADVPFDLVSTPFEAPFKAAFNNHSALIADAVCAGRDQAADHVYRRTYLADDSIAVPAFVSGARPEEHIAHIQPFTVVLGIDIARPVSDEMFNDGGETGGFVGSDATQTALDRAVEAVRRAQGGTDVFVIDSTTFTPATAGDAPRAGDGIPSGHMIERYLQ